MEFSLGEIWIMVGIIFTIVIGTLVSIMLVKIIKVLEVFEDIAGYYTSFKKFIASYNAIPGYVINKIKQFYKRSETENEE